MGLCARFGFFAKCKKFAGSIFFPRGFDGRLIAWWPKTQVRTVSSLLVVVVQWVLRFSPMEMTRSSPLNQTEAAGHPPLLLRAGIALELWGQHGAWNSFASQKCYMERDMESSLSASRVAMGHESAQDISAPQPDGAAG